MLAIPDYVNGANTSIDMAENEYESDIADIDHLHEWIDEVAEIQSNISGMQPEVERMGYQPSNSNDAKHVILEYYHVDTTPKSPEDDQVNFYGLTTGYSHYQTGAHADINVFPVS
jgi:hypothetical protein